MDWCLICAQPQVSKVLVCYGQHVLNVQQVSDPYNDKYKGIWICLQVGAV